MTVRLYVLVRDLPGGRFFAASVDYPSDSAEAGSADAAVAAVISQLEDTIDGMPPTLRVGLGRTAEPELVRVPVTIQLPPGEGSTRASASTAPTTPRSYASTRSTIVRDPRTNARSTAFADVLREGRIDVFLLEALTRRTAALVRAAVAST